MHTHDPVPMPSAGPRVLGFGKHPEIAAAAQDELRRLGFRATNFALTDDAAGDARLISELAADTYAAVVFGGYINGQAEAFSPPAPHTTAWFNRALNIVHQHAPTAKIVLVRGPDDIQTALDRELA
jgi:hypothetical protein